MEALITVNGIVFPDPVNYQPEIESLGSWERNALGDLVGDLVAYKAKLNFTWNMLTNVQYQLLLSAVNPFFITVKYFDPRNSGFTTGTFYAGPRGATLAMRKNGEVWWKDVSFNLIER